MAITFCSETAELLSLQARRTLWYDKRYSIGIKDNQNHSLKIKKKKKHLTAIYKLAGSTLVWNQCCFITSILKSLVIVADWLALIGAIYSRIAHLTINLQESEIYFDNFTNDLQTSPTNDSLWRLSHSYVDMDEVRQTSNLIVTTTSLSTQEEIWSQIFLLFLRDSTPKPKIKKLAKAPTTPPETSPWKPDA